MNFPPDPSPGGTPLSTPKWLKKWKFIPPLFKFQFSIIPSWQAIQGFEGSLQCFLGLRNVFRCSLQRVSLVFALSFRGLATYFRDICNKVPVPGKTFKERRIRFWIYLRLVFRVACDGFQSSSRFTSLKSSEGIRRREQDSGWNYAYLKLAKRENMWRRWWFCRTNPKWMTWEGRQKCLKNVNWRCFPRIAEICRKMSRNFFLVDSARKDRKPLFLDSWGRG